MSVIPPEPLLNSHYSFCPRPCTSLSIKVSKRVSDTVESGKNQTLLLFNFNPTVQVTQSIEKVTLISLFNDFGSSMGLWLGISVFSIFEMVKRLALQMKVGEKWNKLPKILVVLFAFVPIGTACFFVAVTIAYK